MNNLKMKLTIHIEIVFLILLSYFFVLLLRCKVEGGKGGAGEGVFKFLIRENLDNQLTKLLKFIIQN